MKIFHEIWAWLIDFDDTHRCTSVVKNILKFLIWFAIIGLFLSVLHYIVAKDFNKDSDTGEYLSYDELINKGVWTVIFALFIGIVVGGFIASFLHAKKKEKESKKRVKCDSEDCEHNNDGICDKEEIEVYDVTQLNSGSRFVLTGEIEEECSFPTCVSYISRNTDDDVCLPEEIKNDSPQFIEFCKQEKIKEREESKKIENRVLKLDKRLFRVTEHYGNSVEPKILEEHCDIVTAKKHILNYAAIIYRTDKEIAQRNLFMEFINPEFYWPEEIDPEALKYSFEDWQVIFEVNDIVIESREDLDKQIKKFLDNEYQEIMDRIGEYCLEIRECKIDGKGEELVEDDFIQFSMDIEWKDMRLTTNFVNGHFGDWQKIGFEEFASLHNEVNK